MAALTERAQEIFNLKIPGQQTQREKILWMQQNRMHGTWAKCFQCEKWRYLKNIFDPVDIPDKWQCSMNLDNKFNSCEKPQSHFNNNAVVRLKFTAGSLVWVNSARYSRWPGMVDDDPELAQFYWLSPHDHGRKACMYHIVFIDVDYKNTSRQWFSENELIAFTWYNSQAVPGKLSRLMESVRIAREALDMNVFQRLQKFGFARLYRDHIFSFGHAMRSLVVSEGQELDYESDCTLLSCSDTEDEEYYESLRGYPSGFCSRKKRGVISPYEYFERSKEKEMSLKSNSHSKKNNRTGRATSVVPSENDFRKSGRASSVGPSENDLKKRRRASSIGPTDNDHRRERASSIGSNENTLQRRNSLDSGSHRRTPIVPKHKTPQKRERSSLVSPKKNLSQRKTSVASEENKKRRSNGSLEYRDLERPSSVVQDDFHSRNKRTTSVVHDIDSYPKNKRASSVVRDTDSKSRYRRASSVAPDIDSRKKRASSVSHVDSKSKKKRTSSVDSDNDSKSSRKRSSSLVRSIDSDSRNKQASSVSHGKHSAKQSRGRRASSITPDSFFESEHKNKTAPSFPNDSSENDRTKRKAALSAPDNYFKSEGSSKKSRSTSLKENSEKTPRKSLDSSGDYSNSYSRRRSSSVVDSYAEKGRASSTTPSYNYESSSRSKKDSFVNSRERLSNSRSRKDSSKVANDFSENKMGRRSASVTPFDDCETSQRRKRASSVAPVRHRESISRGRRSSSIAPVGYDHGDKTQRKKKTTPTVSISPGGYHDKEASKPYLSGSNYCTTTPRKKTTAPWSHLHHHNQEKPEFYLSGPRRHSVSGDFKKRTPKTSNPSGRLLRSQTRSSEDDVKENNSNSNMDVDNDLRNMNNSLVIPNTPVSSSTPISNSYPTNVPLYGHGLMRRTVYEITTKRWKFTGPNGESYYQDLVTESHSSNSRPF
ncbi:unnamed protein product [Nezara viridula]|uniref:CW-type domain-containing protein n=1 Tax=Nezara viridula TaxID=85310 RepID=A0A9P0HMQ3_NEZVI|nr:unnamed protein product [Nezara viridula]